MEPPPAALDPESRPEPGLPAEVRFCLELGKAFQACGIPAHRFEETLSRIAGKLGISGQFFALPTAFFATLGRDGERWTFIERASSGDANLAKLAGLQAIVDELMEGRIEAAQAARRVQSLMEAPARWGPLATVLCFGLASAPAARFFGGGWTDLALTGVLGLLVGLLSVGFSRSMGLSRLLHPVAGALVGFLALAATACLPATPHVLTLGGLIVLIPGLRLLVGINELATGNLVAGTARLMDTAMIFLGLGFGVFVGQRLASTLWPTLHPAPPPMPGWTLALALPLIASALAVLFQARLRDFPWILLASIMAFLGARLGAHALGPEAGVGLGALLLGLLSNLASRRRNCPSMVTLLPGIMVLVPGGLGFSGLDSILRKQLVAGLDIAFQALFIAVALVVGLLLAHAALPSRTGV